MRSLFLKIFVSFWALIILLVAATVYTSESPQRQEYRHHRDLIHESVGQFGQHLSWTLGHEGSAALKKQAVERSSNSVQIWFFDQANNELTGNPVSKQVKEIVNRVRQTGQLQIDLNHGRILQAQTVPSSPNGSYVVAAEFFSEPLGPPAVQNLFKNLLLGILFSGVICFFLARYLAYPVGQLRQATQQIASGNLSARAGATVGKRRDEIGDLVRDFDTMAGRLESLLQAQTRLLRDISHELRSPLARLHVALGLARLRGNDEVTSALDRIEQESDRLNAMIGSLLTLSKMESNEQPPQYIALELDHFVAEIVHDADFEARDEGKQVVLAAALPCSVNASPELLRSAIENVVRNALRHTAAQTQVEVHLACEDSLSGRSAILTVRDHGPGIPDNELEKIFEPFYRVDDSRERRTGGAGLGLAIARRAVDIHGGTISVRNVPDGGLLVEIRLPLDASTLPRSPQTDLEPSATHKA